MLIGCVREIKEHEYRVGLTPSDVREYTRHGHSVVVERGAGLESGYADEIYTAAGARVVAHADTVFAEADMIVKVKEPQPQEVAKLRPGQLLYTYLHLAADETLTRGLLERGVDCVAYETIQEAGGQLPCLHPMSEIAGKLSVQEGAKYLERAMGGKGILLGGVPGVRRGRVAIVGAGTVGFSACRVAVGMGADVWILDIDRPKLLHVEDVLGSAVTPLFSTHEHIEEALEWCDLLIGAVLIPGARAPRLVRREDLGRMAEGSVLVDVAIDQGGFAETSRPTTHSQPTYVEDGVVHYCVTNMPGTVSETATRALTATTLRYGLQLAAMGPREAAAESPAIRHGLNILGGQLTNQAVAESFGIEWVEPLLAGT